MWGGARTGAAPHLIFHAYNGSIYTKTGEN